jgi:hypothetical protein
VETRTSDERRARMKLVSGRSMAPSASPLSPQIRIAGRRCGFRVSVRQLRAAFSALPGRSRRCRFHASAGHSACRGRRFRRARSRAAGASVFAQSTVSAMDGRFLMSTSRTDWTKETIWSSKRLLPGLRRGRGQCGARGRDRGSRYAGAGSGASGRRRQFPYIVRGQNNQRRHIGGNRPDLRHGDLIV